jgi:hypothetical protein
MIRAVLAKLVLFAFLMAVVPIGMYFTTLKYTFTGVFKALQSPTLSAYIFGSDPFPRSPGGHRMRT